MLIFLFIANFNDIDGACSTQTDAATYEIADATIQFTNSDYTITAATNTQAALTGIRVGNEKIDLTSEVDAADTTALNLPSSTTEHMKCFFYIDPANALDYAAALTTVLAGSWEEENYVKPADSTGDSTSGASSFTLFAVFLTALMFQA